MVRKKYSLRFRFGLRIKHILDKVTNKSQFIRDCILKRDKRFSKRWKSRDTLQSVMETIRDSSSSGLIPPGIAKHINTELKEVLIDLEYEL